MSWITTAIVSAAIMAVVAIIDSHLISKRMPSLKAFLIPVGILHLGFGLAVLGFFPMPETVGITPLVAAFISGVIRSIAAFLFLGTMRSEEVSRIIPVVHTFPVFVVLFAVPLLGESLSFTEWLSIFITVAGAILISVRRGAQGQGRGLRKSFALLMSSSLLIGAANTASKYALGHISFWNLFSINAICFTVMFLLLSMRHKTIKELRDMEKRNQTLALLTLNECIAVVGIILAYSAMEQGPISLVSTMFSVRPLFVFIFALVVSRIFPTVLEERLNRGIVLVKLVSIGLILVGVTLLTLGV